MHELVEMEVRELLN